MYLPAKKGKKGWVRQVVRSPPEENERGGFCDALQLQVPDLLPGPAVEVADARGPSPVLLPGGVNQHHVEFGAKGLH